jgi:hypothetical protein
MCQGVRGTKSLGVRVDKRDRAARGSHANGAGQKGPRERACQGVRGTKSLGVKRRRE